MKRGPKNARNDLTVEDVRKAFSYSKKTGILVWKTACTTNPLRVGTTAGAIDAVGRIRIGMNGRRYLAHRIIWLWVTGKWPEYEVDHRDGVKSNNCWKNLRAATPTQNHYNIGLKKHSSSGYKGVNKTPGGKWYAKIRISGKQTYLGTFTTVKTAYTAYCAAAKKYHGAFARF